MEITVNFKLLKTMFDDLGYTSSSIKIGYFRDVTVNDFNVLLAQGDVLPHTDKTLSEKWDLFFTEFKTSYKKLNLKKGKHGGYTSNAKLFVLNVLNRTEHDVTFSVENVRKIRKVEKTELYKSDIPLLQSLSKYCIPQRDFIYWVLDKVGTFFQTYMFEKHELYSFFENYNVDTKEFNELIQKHSINVSTEEFTFRGKSHRIYYLFDNFHIFKIQKEDEKDYYDDICPMFDKDNYAGSDFYLDSFLLGVDNYLGTQYVLNQLRKIKAIKVSQLVSLLSPLGKFDTECLNLEFIKIYGDIDVTLISHSYIILSMWSSKVVFKRTDGSWVQLDDNTAVSEMVSIKHTMEKQIEQIYEMCGV